MIRRPPRSTQSRSSAASDVYKRQGHSDATFLSTADGGTTFTDTPIIPCESMESLSCASPLDCTAVGTSDAMGCNDLTAGVVATTSDGGHTWVPGSLPVGFGISQGSEISCGDAHHCSVSGNISIAIPNPPQCSSLPPAAQPSTTTTQPATPSQAVQAIAQAESRTASAVANKSATSGGDFS